MFIRRCCVHLLAYPQTGEVFCQRHSRAISNKVEDAINQRFLLYRFLFLPLGPNNKKALNVTFTSRHVIRLFKNKIKNMPFKIILHDGQFGIGK